MPISKFLLTSKFFEFLIGITKEYSPFQLIIVCGFQIIHLWLVDEHYILPNTLGPLLVGWGARFILNSSLFAFKFLVNFPIRFILWVVTCGGLCRCFEYPSILHYKWNWTLGPPETYSSDEKYSPFVLFFIICYIGFALYKFFQDEFVLEYIKNITDYYDLASYEIEL